MNLPPRAQLHLPVPVTLMVCGPLFALLFTVIVAFADPSAVGAKRTMILHFRFAATDEQPSDTENSLDPEMMTLATVTLAPPFFAAVLVNVIPLTFALPT